MSTHVAGLNSALRQVVEGLVRSAVHAATEEAAEKAKAKVIQAMALWTTKIASHAEMHFEGQTLTVRIKLDNSLFQSGDRQAIIDAVFGKQ